MAMSNAAVVRLQLVGQHQVLSGLNSVSGAVGNLSTRTAAFGAVAKTAGGRGFFLNQVLFTMRRYAYMATLGLDAAATGAVYMGIKFNAAMESNTVAFEQFLGSTQAATKELDHLYDLAKYTPFEFGDVTEAARRFLAFGYTLKETNENLMTIGDTVAAFGGGRDEIQRMVTVFGQIKASGRLLGQDMLQLQQMGIPTMEILLKQLGKYGVTRKDLARIGELGIPAEVGIPALLKGMNELFGGASARQAQTFNGQISTLHDNISQLMGALTLSEFKKASKGLLPGLNDMFSDISDLIRKQKGRITIAQVFDIAGQHYTGLRPFFAFMKTVIDFGRELGKTFQVLVLPALILVAKIVGAVLIPVLKGATVFLHLMNSQSTWLKRVVQVLTIAFIVQTVAIHRNAIAMFFARRVSVLLRIAYMSLRGVVLLTRIAITLLTISFWRNLAAMTAIATSRALQVLRQGFILGPGGFQKMNRFEKILLKLRVFMVGRLVPAFTAATVAAGRMWMVITTGSVRGAGGRFAKMTAFEKILLRMRVFIIGRLIPAFSAMWVAATGPVGWIIIGIVALIALLVVLYFKWKWFHNLVNSIGRWIWKHWKLASAIMIFTLGPLGLMAAMILIIAKNWGKVWFVLTKIWKLISFVFNWIRDHWRLIAVILLGPFAPFAAAVLGIIGLFDRMIGIVKRLIGWVKDLVGWVKKVPGWIKGAPGWVWGKIKGGAGAVAGAVSGGGGGASAGASFPFAYAPASGGTIPVLGETSPIGQSVLTGGAQSYKYDWSTNTTVNIDGKEVAKANARHRQNAKARK